MVSYFHLLRLSEKQNITPIQNYRQRYDLKVLNFTSSCRVKTEDYDFY